MKTNRRSETELVGESLCVLKGRNCSRTCLKVLPDAQSIYTIQFSRFVFKTIEPRRLCADVQDGRLR